MAGGTHDTFLLKSPNFIGERFNTENCLFGNYSWMKPLSILQHMYTVLIVLPVIAAVVLLFMLVLSFML